MPELPNFEPAPEILLGRASLTGRLAGELARLRRSGGFLSLVILGPARSTPRLSLTVGEQVCEVLRPRVRLHDVLVQLDETVAIVMPQTTAREAQRACVRLMGVCAGDIRLNAHALVAGVATVFREVEGGAHALMAAAQEAFELAVPGQILASTHLQGRPWILIVDDDAALAGALAEAVTERGWEGHPCIHVEDALARVEEPTYSALIVDLVLAHGSGVAVLRKAIAAQPRRPVALMSGHDAGHAGVMEALELGPVMFVPKPISGGDLDVALAMFRSLLPGAGPEARGR
jgi:ActR/RegA family two-component response regulator